MAPLVDVPADKRLAFDPQRDAREDYLFAKGMNSGMGGYEQAVAERKQALFSQLFTHLAAGAGAAGAGAAGAEATVVEVGMGTFPNARYYFDPAVGGDGGRTYTLDLVGVDPNDAMESYARDNLAKAASTSAASSSALPASGASGASLRIVHGAAEALPLPSNSADAVVCTLTLCSVSNPAAALAEIKRVLKPGAPFLFIEHVLSEVGLDELNSVYP
jgi:SAM-dependent methyltransferase